MATKAVTANDVLLYMPNLIGYTRILCATMSFVLMICNSTDNNNTSGRYWLLATILYLMNFLGDLIDGLVARYYNQCSSYGGVLDMITDRCSTAGLLFVLAGEYTSIDVALPFPLYRILFLFLMILDISSHWVQMHSTLALQVHHKSDEGNKGKNFLVQWFYKYYYFFGYLCVGAEFTYILLYVRLHFIPTSALTWYASSGLEILLIICIPGCFMKQLVNIAQLASSCRTIAQHDADVTNDHKKTK
jgi:CDP-diacylglycerol--inositol 3-phosphatidyltransferase